VEWNTDTDTHTHTNTERRSIPKLIPEKYQKDALHKSLNFNRIFEEQVPGNWASLPLAGFSQSQQPITEGDGNFDQ